MVVGQVKQGKITYERFVPSLEHPVPRQICVSNMNVRLAIPGYEGRRAPGKFLTHGITYHMPMREDNVCVGRRQRRAQGGGTGGGQHSSALSVQQSLDERQARALPAGCPGAQHRTRDLLQLRRLPPLPRGRHGRAGAGSGSGAGAGERAAAQTGAGSAQAAAAASASQQCRLSRERRVHVKTY